jgi:cytoskeletal protein CcmA (bactofilin family)
MKDIPQSFLDRGAAFEGKISFSGVVRIDGHFSGDATAPGTLVIGGSGVVEANLSVGSLVVQGSVSGDITARERVEVAATGTVTGTLRTPALRIEEGASVTAKVEMRAPPPRPSDAPTQQDAAATRDLKSGAALP